MLTKGIDCINDCVEIVSQYLCYQKVITPEALIFLTFLRFRVMYGHYVEGGFQVFENEVNYRLAKWVLLNMAHEGVISDEEMRLALINIVGVYEPPFFELEEIGRASCRERV